MPARAIASRIATAPRSTAERTAQRRAVLADRRPDGGDDDRPGIAGTSRPPQCTVGSPGRRGPHGHVSCSSSAPGRTPVDRGARAASTASTTVVGQPDGLLAGAHAGGDVPALRARLAPRRRRRRTRSRPTSRSAAIAPADVDPMPIGRSSTTPSGSGASQGRRGPRRARHRLAKANGGFEATLESGDASPPTRSSPLPASPLRQPPGLGGASRRACGAHLRPRRLRRRSPARAC